MAACSLSMSGFRDKQRTLVNTVSSPEDAGSSPGKQTDHPTQVPKDITLGLLWPKFTRRYCIQKEIIKLYKGKCLARNKKMPFKNRIPGAGARRAPPRRGS
jgi:hypothetical protein